MAILTYKDAIFDSKARRTANVAFGSAITFHYDAARTSTTASLKLEIGLNIKFSEMLLLLIIILGVLER